MHSPKSLSGMHGRLSRARGIPVRAVVNIDDPTLLDMQKKFADAQVEVTVRDITSDIGIPTMAAVADDVLLKDPSLLTIGIGTHTSARIAVMRALTEVAQSRLTQIHGAREDTTIADLRKKMGYDRAKRINGTGSGITGRLTIQTSRPMTATTSKQTSGLLSTPCTNRALNG